MPLTVHLLKPPSLISRPPIVNALRPSLYMLPFHIVKPRLQEVVVINILEFDPSAFALDLSEYLVLMLTEGVVESALLHRAANAAGGYLVDVEVGVFLGGVIDVFGYGEGDGGVGDGFAEEPGYALLVGVLDWLVLAMRKVVQGYHL